MRYTVFLMSCLLALASGCNSNATEPSPLLRQPAPGFSAATLDGGRISLSELKGQVVLLDFWATWCPPCREGLPHLQALAKDADLAKRGLVVLAMNDGETPETLHAFLDRMDHSYKVVLDPDASIAADYKVKAIPTSVIVGRDGVVQDVIIGLAPDQVRAAVTRALQAPAP